MARLKISSARFHEIATLRRWKRPGFVINWIIWADQSFQAGNVSQQIRFPSSDVCGLLRPSTFNPSTLPLSSIQAEEWQQHIWRQRTKITFWDGDRRLPSRSGGTCSRLCRCHCCGWRIYCDRAAGNCYPRAPCRWIADRNGSSRPGNWWSDGPVHHRYPAVAGSWNCLGAGWDGRGNHWTLGHRENSPTTAASNNFRSLHFFFILVTIITAELKACKASDKNIPTF